MVELSLETLKVAAAEFAEIESRHDEPSLFGKSDGKAVGTYLEKKFVRFLESRFTFERGNAGSGLDIPGLSVDIKTTSITNGKPQSSCPFESPRQKVYGLGYHLLIFIYRKTDDPARASSRLDVETVIFIDAERTGDFLMTKGLRALLADGANAEELIDFMIGRNLPIDEISGAILASELLRRAPEQGCLTISTAHQWRLDYGRAVALSGESDGVLRLR